MRQAAARGRGLTVGLIVRVGGALTLAVGLVACRTALTTSAPHPDRPEIGLAALAAIRVRSGCPIRLHITFGDAEANIARALASWTYDASATLAGRPARVAQDGFAAVALDRASLMGRRRGEAEIVLTPLQPGQYRYSVQVEDAEGHRSNVVETSFTVLPQPAGAPVSCSEPVQ
jgi:hypothetical protein